MAAMTGALSGRTILVTGGAGGSGATAARELHRLGATVVIGTRSPERYAAMAGQLGGDRVHSFLANLTDEEAVETELLRMALDGVRITDLVHCAAGGLEPIMRRFVRRLVGLRSMPSARRPGAVDMLRVELRGWLVDTTELAWRINCAAPRSLTRRLLPSLPEGGHVVFYSSLWSSFYGRSPVPAFYHTVAASKLAFEGWLETNAPEWAARGISASIISGHVIRDTQLGRLINDSLVPLLPPEQQARARSFHIAAADMARVLVAELAAPPPEIGAPARWRYVFGPGGQAVDELEPNAPPLAYGTPLPDLAMRPVLAP
jgi:NAD(P)-dependent dehydrogenase (short-subunit alcohol dehydrogenase family)